MRVIGVTGGVGSGKSAVLNYIEAHFDARIVKADDVGHLLMMPGQACYEPVISLFGEWIVKEDGSLDRETISKIVFEKKEMLEKLNGIIHPAVKKYIRRRLEEERDHGRQLAVVEAALLLEDHYEEFCDEIWYVHTDADIRIQRLMTSRGYTREKAESIIRNQATEVFFRSHADYVVENNGDLSVTYEQIVEGIKRIETL